MIIKLKGAPSYSIDQDGIMGISTTWLLIDDTSQNVFGAWLAFQNAVETWAGNVGDAYKKPKQDTAGRECSAYDVDTTFKVQSIQIDCVSGRTHYEVSFVHTQNLAAMKQIGNVAVDINNNNEKTKTISYQVDVASTTPTEIDSKLIVSGTTVAWTGESYLVESSTYQPQGKTRYTITITAKDMSYMMIGLPTSSTDAFGQKVKSATWRFSKTVFETWVQPEIGADASEYIGEVAGSGYLISAIDVSPDGVLGYQVRFDARHVSRRLVKVDKRLYQTEGKRTAVDATLTYQSDEDNKDGFETLVGEEAVDFDLPNNTIKEVNVSPTGKGEYEITLSTVDDVNTPTVFNYNDNSQEALRNKVEISMSSSTMTLEPLWMGWDTGPSGVGYYAINFPPTTRFSYQEGLSTFVNMRTDTGEAVKGFTEADIIAAIKAGTKLGYDEILYPIGKYKGKNPDGSAMTTKDAYGRIPKDKYPEIEAGDVTDLVLSGFTYAQPSWTVSSSGNSLRNVYFVPWKASESTPIFLLRNWLTSYPQEKERDLPNPKAWINRKLPMFESSVGLYYQGNARTVLKKSTSQYYKNAIKHIRTGIFTHHKGAGFTVSETLDNKGATWTMVTCTIQSLTYGYWNKDYDNSYVEMN